MANKNFNIANLFLNPNQNNSINNTITNLQNLNFTHPDNIMQTLPFFILNEYGIIGGICSTIALILASHQIVMHLYFFNEPKLQLYIVRILLMVPVRKF
jgi:hypothetical protein